MASSLIEIFEDTQLTQKVQKRLPYFFQLAEIECSRAGKIGMEVGSVREKIIIALLIYKFGQENVETNIPITESEVDVRLSGQPISIKSITGKSNGVKLCWTVDAQSAKEFSYSYEPRCDLLLVRIVWGAMGGFYFIPLDVQRRLLGQIGREKYIKLPVPGTNPRGVEMTSNALALLLEDRNTRALEISWQRTPIDFNPYKRWVDYWGED